MATKIEDRSANIKAQEAPAQIRVAQGTEPPQTKPASEPKQADTHRRMSQRGRYIQRMIAASQAPAPTLPPGANAPKNGVHKDLSPPQYAELMQKFQLEGATQKMSLSVLASAQYKFLKDQADAAGQSIGEYLQAFTLSKGFKMNEATWWPSLKQEEKDHWNDIAQKAFAKVKEEGPQEVRDAIAAAEAAGGGLKFNPVRTEELNDAYAFLQGNSLMVSKKWILTAFRDPSAVYENIIHELSGHLEYGETVSAPLMLAVQRNMPFLEYQKLSQEESLLSVTSYFETEIYAELRELEFRTPTSIGDFPQANVPQLLHAMRDSFAPEVAEALVRGLHHRVQNDERVSKGARQLLDESIKTVFNIDF